MIAMPHDKYVFWQRACLTQMMRLLKDEGAIFYNHKWRVQNGLLQDRQDIVAGFPVRQIIIWQRKGGINFNRGYFLPTYEVIYLIAKPKFRLAPKANAYGDVWSFTQEMGRDERGRSSPPELGSWVKQACLLVCPSIERKKDLGYERKEEGPGVRASTPAAMVQSDCAAITGTHTIDHRSSARRHAA
jgi:hypothetical protein